MQCVHLSWTWFRFRCIAPFLLAVVDTGDGHGWLLPSSFHPPCSLMFSPRLLWFSLMLWRFGKEGRRGHKGTWTLLLGSLSRHFYSFCESFKNLISGDSFTWMNLVRLIFLFLSHLWLPSSVLISQMWDGSSSRSTVWFLVSSSYRGTYVYDASEIDNHCVKAKLHC